MLSVLRPPFSVLQTVSINSTSEEAGERAETGERKAESGERKAEGGEFEKQGYQLKPGQVASVMGLLPLGATS